MRERSRSTTSRSTTQGVRTHNTMPHCLEAEQSALGIAFRSARLAKQLVAELELRDFYGQKNQVVHKLIGKYLETYPDLAKDDSKLELGLFAELAMSSPYHASYPDLVSYICQLVSSNSKVPIDGYIRVLKKYTALRKAIEKGSVVVEEAYSLTDPDKLALKLEEVAKEIVGVDKSSVITLAEACLKLESSADDGSRYRTGFADFDRYLNKGTGFCSTDLIVGAGRPGMGKTMLAINIARAGLVAGKTVGFFSIEMSDTQIAERFMHLERSIRGNTEAIVNYNLHIRDGRIGIEDVHQYLEKLSAQGQKPDLVIVDYIQIMSAPRELRREEQIAYISRSLKSLAVEYKTPILALSQLNRECERRKDKRPILSDLRESGAIEQDADVIVFLYRDEMYNEATRDRGIAELILAKNRNGRAGITIKLLFEPENSRFKSIAFDPAPF